VVTGPEVKADHQEEQDVTFAETERLTILLRNKQTETSRSLRNRDEIVAEKARHRDDAGHGCLFAALGSDIVRQPQSVRRAVTEGLRSRLEALQKLLPGRSAPSGGTKRWSSWAVWLAH
jgi:hypothetical protein